MPDIGGIDGVITVNPIHEICLEMGFSWSGYHLMPVGEDTSGH
jgi:hypothetical protein